jgi:hypothetical protein
VYSGFEVYIGRSAVYSITMNDNPKDYPPLEVMKLLDFLVSNMYADVTDRVLGPVIEHDYYIDFKIEYGGVLFEEGLHRITTDADGYPVAYTPPKED